MTVVIRGHDSGQCVKMNDAIQTRPARSASVTTRPERSTSRKGPSSKAWSPRSWPARAGAGTGPTVARQRRADATTVPTTIERPRRYEESTVRRAPGVSRRVQERTTAGTTPGCQGTTTPTSSSLGGCSLIGCMPMSG